MSLEIIVCIKQVPAPEYYSKLTLDPEKFTLVREGIPSVVNPIDRYALEEGLRIRERFAGKVTALSMGPPQAREALEEVLAMGADDAILLCDRALAGGDTLATAHALACAIQKLGKFDLILCGNEAIDGATGQVGPQLAEFLDIPHVTHAEKIEFTDENSARVTSAIEYGHLNIDLQLPALIAVMKEINHFRLPTVMGIMEVANKEIKSWGCTDIESDMACIGLEGSPTRVIGVSKQESGRSGELLQGPPEEVAHKAVRRLYELGVIQSSRIEVMDE
ncbi:electron transfer flavoprotein subunit beta/FixA family protein [Chloroflexota bacterium]